MQLGEIGRGSPIESQLIEAWDWVNKEFPFPGYISVDRRESYIGMAYAAWRTLNGKGKVLDFGCGPLDKTAIFSRIGLEVVAFDDFLDAWHRQNQNLDLIKSFAKKANIDLLVADEHPSGLDALGEGYDMVMLHHVLEHLKDSPCALLNLLLRKLKTGGFLYTTVPNAVNLRKRIAVAKGKTNYSTYASYYWAEDEYRGHIREYVRDDLVQMAQFLGLEIVVAGNYNHFWNAVPKRMRWGVRALCKLVPGFCDSCSLIARKPENWQPKEKLTDQELYAAIDASVPFDYGKVLGSKNAQDN